MPEPNQSEHRPRPIDVGARQVGAVYAKSLLGAAESEGQLDAVIADLDTLVTEVLDRFPDFEKVLASALIKHEQKSALIDRSLGSSFSPLLVRFLKVVARHGRLDTLRAIHYEAHKLYDDVRGLVRVDMSTATAVNGPLLENLKTAISKMLGRKLEIEPSVDPKLIGGVVLKVGDTVYDGSVARQLAQVRQQMIDRSVHEIQSRRDRFRNPGGN